MGIDDKGNLVSGKALYDALIKKLSENPDAYKQSVVGETSFEAPCGTAGCIGGWGMVLSGLVSQETLQQQGRGVQSDLIDAWTQLTELMGLNSHQANKLFAYDPAINWPSPYNSRWAGAQTNKERAQIAVDLLTQIRDEGPQVLNDDDELLENDQIVWVN